MCDRGNGHLASGWVVLATLATWVVAAPAQTPAEAEALLAQARPVLEEALGGRFAQPVRCRTVSAMEWGRLADAELDGQLRIQAANLEPVSARAVAAEALRQAMFARFEQGGDTVLVLPDTAPLAAWVERQTPAGLAPAEFRRQVLQLALVEQATWAVLTQRYGLAARWAACRDDQEFQALQGVVAGRAQWVTRQVARRLGSETAFPVLAHACTQAPDVAQEPGLRLLARDVLRRRHWACTCGLRFWDELERQGLGNEAKVFARPPRQTAWLERPELYCRAERLGLPDLAESLARLERSLTPAGWTGAQQPWTPAMVRQAAALLGQKERGERVAAGWDDGRTLVWTAKDSPGRQVAVGIVRFQDEATSRAYFGLAVDLQRKQDELLSAACADGRRVLESRPSAVSIAGTDEAARSDKQLQLAKDGPPVCVSQMWVRAGNRVVEITWNGVTGDNAWAERVVREVLAGDCQPGSKR